jgi:hypothetical protein
MHEVICKGNTRIFHTSPRPFVIFLNKLIVYGQEDLEDHLLSAVCDCSFNMFAATPTIQSRTFCLFVCLKT